MHFVGFYQVRVRVEYAVRGLPPDANIQEVTRAPANPNPSPNPNPNQVATNIQEVYNIELPANTQALLALTLALALTLTLTLTLPLTVPLTLTRRLS